jgi:hypothetical protein
MESRRESRGRESVFGGLCPAALPDRSDRNLRGGAESPIPAGAGNGPVFNQLLFRSEELEKSSDSDIQDL